MIVGHSNTIASHRQSVVVATSDRSAITPTSAPTERPKCNTPAVQHRMKHKDRASRVLTPLGLQPWSVTVSTGTRMRDAAACKARLALFEEDQGRQIPFPVVVKTTAGTKGEGVKTGVKSVAGVCAAMGELFTDESDPGGPWLERQKAIVEQFVSGDVYRVMVYSGRVIDVVGRVMAFVVGDGAASLQNLIKARNLRQKSAGMHATFSVSWDMIKDRYDLGRASVVPDGAKVQITLVGNYHNGCNPYHVPLDTIHPDHLKKWVAANDALGAAFSGMDYVSPNISEPTGYVVDVNTMADDIIHLKAHYGTNPEQHTWLPFQPPPPEVARNTTRPGENVYGEPAEERDRLQTLIPCYYCPLRFCRAHFPD